MTSAAKTSVACSSDHGDKALQDHNPVEKLRRLVAQLMEQVNLLAGWQENTEKRIGELQKNPNEKGGNIAAAVKFAATDTLCSSQMSLPTYDGSIEPTGWIGFVGRLFKQHPAVTEKTMLEIVVVHLRGEAQVWFDWYRSTGRLQTWTQFALTIQLRFGEDHGHRPSKTTTTVSQSQIHPRVVQELLTQGEEVGRMCPNLAREAMFWFSASQRGEAAKIRVYHDLEDEFSDSFVAEDTRKQQQQIPQIYSKHKPNVQKVKGAGAIGGSGPPVAKLLSCVKRGEKPEKDLCFQCDEKQCSRHQCSAKLGGFVSKDKGDMAGLARAASTGSLLSFLDTEKVLRSQYTCIPLQTVTGLENPWAFKLFGPMEGKKCLISIDPAASHSFIDSSLADNWGLEIDCYKLKPVNVGEKRKLVTQGCLRKCRIEMQEYHTVEDLDIMPLECKEVVLGISWLEMLGPVTMGYKKKEISFEEDGKIKLLKCLLSREVQEIILGQLSMEPDQDACVSMLQCGLDGNMDSLKEEIIQEVHGLLEERRGVDKAATETPLCWYSCLQNVKIESQFMERERQGLFQISLIHLTSAELVVKKHDVRQSFRLVYPRLYQYKHLHFPTLDHSGTATESRAEVVALREVGCHGFSRKRVMNRDGMSAIQFYTEILLQWETKHCQTLSVGRMEALNFCQGTFLHYFYNQLSLHLLRWFSLTERWYNIIHHPTHGFTYFDVWFGRQPLNLPSNVLGLRLTEHGAKMLSDCDDFLGESKTYMICCEQRRKLKLELQPSKTPEQAGAGTLCLWTMAGGAHVEAFFCYSGGVFRFADDTTNWALAIQSLSSSLLVKVNGSDAEEMKD